MLYFEIRKGEEIPIKSRSLLRFERTGEIRDFATDWEMRCENGIIKGYITNLIGRGVNNLNSFNFLYLLGRSYCGDTRIQMVSFSFFNEDGSFDELDYDTENKLQFLNWSNSNRLFSVFPPQEF